MSHTYSNCLIHFVFSTNDRRKLIQPDLQENLWSYIGGIARKNKMKALAVGGMEDHVHVLLSIPSTMTIAKAVQLIKGGSSKWIHENFPQHRNFSWQKGYGAFSIGISSVNNTMSYISNQKEHHKSKAYQEEFIQFLNKHGIEYNEKYVWG